MQRRYRIALYIGLSVVGILLALVAGLFGVLQTGFARDQMRHLDCGRDGRQLDRGASRRDRRAGAVRHAAGRSSPVGSRWRLGYRPIASLLSWSPSALLAGRLQVDALTAGAIDVARAPAAEQTQEPEEPGPLIPELPIAIDLRRLSVERVALAAPILGEPAALSLEAQAQLGEIARRRDSVAAGATA